MSDKILNKIEDLFKESIRVKEETSRLQSDAVAKIVEVICNSLKSGGKVLVFGNGGSAADSQHIAGELIGRFKKERSSFAAVALTTDTSILTSIGNDYGFDKIFARQIEGLGKPGDVAIGISTSGNAANVVLGLEQAKKMGLRTVAWTAGNGGKIGKIAELVLLIPSGNTPRIQEAHITCGHIICELVEEELSK
jgi:D-sedoheptulose 7-phosphate isomerase